MYKFFRHIKTGEVYLHVKKYKNQRENIVCRGINSNGKHSVILEKNIEFIEMPKNWQGPIEAKTNKKIFSDASEKRKRVVDLYEKGFKQVDIAKITGYSKTIIYKAIHPEKFTKYVEKSYKLKKEKKKTYICRDCGKTIKNMNRFYCSDCWEKRINYASKFEYEFEPEGYDISNPASIPDFY